MFFSSSSSLHFVLHVVFFRQKTQIMTIHTAYSLYYDQINFILTISLYTSSQYPFQNDKTNSIRYHDILLNIPVTIIIVLQFFTCKDDCHPSLSHKI